jgi:hypothetical protein
MVALRDALAFLKKNRVQIEDPGDEIGPRPKVRRIWACGFATKTAIAGSCPLLRDADAKAAGAKN